MDISQDVLLFDNLETVQYSVRTAESTYAAVVPVGFAQREPVLSEQTTGGALLPRVTGYWSFWSAALATAGIGPPRVGDQFQDQDGNNWQVLSVESSRWWTGWRLNALKVR